MCKKISFSYEILYSCIPLRPLFQSRLAFILIPYHALHRVLHYPAILIKVSNPYVLLTGLKSSAYFRNYKAASLSC